MPQKRTALWRRSISAPARLPADRPAEPCPPSEALRGRKPCRRADQDTAKIQVARHVISRRGRRSDRMRAGGASGRWRWPNGWPRSGSKSVLLSVSGGRLHGQLIEAAADIRGGAVTSADVTRVTSTGMRHATGEGRTVLACARPVGYALDGVKGIRDPRGMVARQFGVDMNVVTSDATVAKNLMLVVRALSSQRRSHGGEPLCGGPVGVDRR